MYGVGGTRNLKRELFYIIFDAESRQHYLLLVDFRHSALVFARIYDVAKSVSVFAVCHDDNSLFAESIAIFPGAKNEMHDYQGPIRRGCVGLGDVVCVGV